MSDETVERRSTDHAPESSPDANSIALTIIRMFLSKSGHAQWLTLPAGAVMGVIVVACIVGVPAILASAAVVTGWRNQELQAKQAEMQSEMERLRLQLEVSHAKEPISHDSICVEGQPP